MANNLFNAGKKLKVMAEEKKDEKNINQEVENSQDKENIDINDQTENKSESKNESKKKSKIFDKKKKTKKDPISDLEDVIKKLQEKNEEVTDKYLRLVAEYDNYRKRTAKEKLEIRESATSYVLKDLLPVLDDIDRAVEHNKQTEDIKVVKEGFEIINKKFAEFLKCKSIEVIDALHKDFDTDFHEAITKIPAPSEDLKGKVVDVVEKGYKIGDKVIRYSKVVVGE